MFYEDMTVVESKKTILIPGCDSIYMTKVASVIHRMGYRAIVMNEADAVEQVRGASPDMVLLYVGMSCEDGIRHLRSLKAQRDLFTMPVGVISSDPDMFVKDQCLRLGVDSYMMKPVSAYEIHNMLQECLYDQTGYCRDNLRLCYEGSVMVAYEGMQVSCMAQTLSEKGIFVIKRPPLPFGAHVWLTFALRGEESVSVEGKVIYTVDEGMGMVFNESGHETLARISGYIKEELSIAL